MRSRQVAGKIDDAVVVRIKTGDGAVGLRVSRLFFERQRATIGIEFDHAIVLRMLDMVAEHRGALGARGGVGKQVAEMGAEEDIVAKHQRDAVFADKVRADGEGLGQAVGSRLLGVLDRQAEGRAIRE